MKRLLAVLMLLATSSTFAKTELSVQCAATVFPQDTYMEDCFNSGLDNLELFPEMIVRNDIGRPIKKFINGMNSPLTIEVKRGDWDSFKDLLLVYTFQDGEQIQSISINDHSGFRTWVTSNEGIEICQICRVKEI